jgi:hypothetical protein
MSRGQSCLERWGKLGVSSDPRHGRLAIAGRPFLSDFLFTVDNERPEGASAHPPRAQLQL